MDGAEGVLGIGGPIFLRKGSNLTSVGVIQLDKADVGRIQLAGIMETTITHEMVHILGFSTFLWQLEERIFPRDVDPSASTKRSVDVMQFR